MYRFFKPVSLLLVLLSISCVEHVFTVVVFPEGNFDVIYSAHGNREDLVDMDFPLPADSSWRIISTLDTGESESYDYSATKWFGKNEPVPDNFYQGDSLYGPSLLKHPMEIKTQYWFLNKTYTFTCTFEDRKVSSRYPKLAQRFREESEDEDWLGQALTYIFRETLAQTDVGFNLSPVLTRELEEWLESSVISVSDTLLAEQFDVLKAEGLNRLKASLDSTKAALMDSIFKQLVDEVKITDDLADDEFEFQLILPGEIVDTNADTTRGDTIFWKFGLSKYMDENFQMYAKSRLVYPGRYKVLIGLVLLLAVLVGLGGWYYSRKK